MNHERLLIAVTSPLACSLYSGGLLTHLRSAGIEPVLLSSPGAYLTEVSAKEGVESIAVPMERQITPIQDLVSLWKLYWTIRRVRPTVTEVSTPKAGLLAGVAAWLARVPCRVYTLRGLRLETARGPKRAILLAAEWLACACSHRVVCVSPSLRERAINLNLVSPEKSTVLVKGSRGVDTKRFSEANRNSPEIETLRGKLGIPPGAPVVGFVGRLVKDKGIRQLVEAFQQLRVTYPQLHLLLVGDFEPGDPVEPEVRRYIESETAIIRPGFVSDTAPYYPLMDVLALPTYREGFPGAPLEAQASSVPVVTTTATGAVDSIIDGVTGLIVPVGDATALAESVSKLLADPDLRRRMGKAGREHTERDFQPEVIWDALIHLYRGLIEEKLGCPETASENKIPLSKRFLDVILGTGALLLLSPLLMVIAILIKLSLGSPVLFRQERAGFFGSRFECLKFRTMTNACDENGQLLPDADRLTRLGRLLRSASLDEVPELINVIRGEMSLVGPRPLLAKYLERYSPEQMRRHAVRPGITGWAQINGRNLLNWNERFEFDVWYVDHWSFWLDLSILTKTVWQVIRREGIAKPGHATMPEFRGLDARPDQGNIV
ncbi:MAG TPA: sugar transferase [Terriglobales bacterium]|jgi:lipopolysaccharide/colanic/teichoic acid biosynthesis glycosyltransferase/glycosyltransferase involved in cell wall biosynthesis|nr:sugar transferase [Terriglobales bacterium]